MNYILKIYNRFINNYNQRRELLAVKGIFSYFFNSSGYVLIIVLIVTTLLISISSEFMIVAQTNVGYIRKLDYRLRAGYLAKSGIELGKYILYADQQGLSSEALTGKAVDKNIDSYNDIWAIDIPPLPMEDGSVKITFEDENAKINLSVLATEFADEGTPFFRITERFFLNMMLPIDLADVIRDWVDIDDSRGSYGAESADYYLTLTPPYSAKNAGMDSIDELLLLKGFTPEIYYGLGGGNSGTEQNLVEHNKGHITLDMDKIKELTSNPDKAANPIQSDMKNDESIKMRIGKEKSRKLSDYFTVYGNRQNFLDDLNKININTASYRVLSALTDNMGDDIVTEIISRRIIKPFSSVEEINDLLKGSDAETIKKLLTVKSYIFKITASAVIENAEVKIVAVYNRSNRKILYWSEE